MEVSDRTGQIVKALEPHAQFITTLPDGVTKSMLGLYSDIASGTRQLLKLRGKLTGNIVNIIGAQTNSGKYFPDNIQQHIAANVNRMVVYKTNVDRRTVTIEFGVSEDQVGDLDELRAFVDFIVVWLHVCSVYAKDTCAKSLKIRIFMTPFYKVLPDTNSITLGPTNVNTGFSYFCAEKGEIVIYRKEEWKKVFIHETFHAFGLDLGGKCAELTQRMKKLFPVRSEHAMTEAYTETWARICNSAMCAYLCVSGKPTRDKYMQALIFNMGIERMYAVVQCDKALGHMGLVYESLIGDSDTDTMLRLNLYREDSNVLAYYIVTAVLLSDFPRFIAWCRKHNTTLLRFRAVDSNYSSFADMIEALATSNEFIDLVREIGSVRIPGMESSLTMSAVEGV
jgi:hypothetical protein